MSAVISSNPGLARDIVMKNRSATARMLAMASGKG
jgi:prephenate dehydrogenase